MRDFLKIEIGGDQAQFFELDISHLDFSNPAHVNYAVERVTVFLKEGLPNHKGANPSCVRIDEEQAAKRKRMVAEWAANKEAYPDMSYDKPLPGPLVKVDLKGADLVD